MKTWFAKLWHDDVGALISAEYVFLAAILITGTVVGLSSLRNAVNAELSELANAYLALSQGYAFSGQSGCAAGVDGSQAIDTPSTVTPPTSTTVTNPSYIQVLSCN